MVITRKGNEVFFENNKLTIVAQASKGPGKEVVKITGLEGANGQKWVSLSRLVEGDNEITTSGRQVSTTSRYSLTTDEQKKVDALQAKIDEIVNAAKARFVSKPNLKVNINALTGAEKEAAIANLEKYLASLKANA